MFTKQHIKNIPKDIELIVTDGKDLPVDLFDVEASFQAKATPKRRKEFALGRSCARKALQRYGIPSCPIPVGDNREPLWPAGFVGSITHCEGLYAAAVTCKSRYLALGIDAEPNKGMPSEISDLILTQREKNWLKRRPVPKNVRRIIFSAKESVYKCLSPLTNRFIDFTEVDIAIDNEESLFLAHLPPDIARMIGAQIISGTFFQSESHLFTATFLREG